jgi:transposase
MWVQRGSLPGRAIILFHCDPSRGQGVALELLEGFSGFLQTDAFEVYAAIAAARPGIRHVGCFAHARRRFGEAVKAGAKAGKAQMGFAFIQRLYAVERTLKDADPETRARERSTLATPILPELRAWLERSLPKVPPSSLTGKALSYLHRQWPKLVAYLDEGRLAIDTNACERAVRPFVIGRRNWLFADTPKGAAASAALYSLIETAKANGHEPYGYLRFFFTTLPAATTPEPIAALPPFNIAPDALPSHEGARG